MATSSTSVPPQTPMEVDETRNLELGLRQEVRQEVRTEKSFGASVNASFGSASNLPALSMSMNWQEATTAKVNPAVASMSELHLPNVPGHELPVARATSLPIRTVARTSPTPQQPAPMPSAPIASDSGSSTEAETKLAIVQEDWIVEGSDSESCYGEDSAESSDDGSVTDLRHFQTATEDTEYVTADEDNEQPQQDVPRSRGDVIITIDQEEGTEDARVRQQDPGARDPPKDQPSTDQQAGTSGSGQAGNSGSGQDVQPSTSGTGASAAGASGGDGGDGAGDGDGGNEDGGDGDQPGGSQGQQRRQAQPRGRGRGRTTRGRTRKSRKRPWDLSDESLSSPDDEAGFPSRISPRNKKPFQGYTKF